MCIPGKGTPRVPPPGSTDRHHHPSIPLNWTSELQASRLSARNVERGVKGGVKQRELSGHFIETLNEGEYDYILENDFVLLSYQGYACNDISELCRKHLWRRATPPSLLCGCGC